MIGSSTAMSFAGALVTALVAALMGFWLAKARFKHDQLWQEKNLTYKKVLSAVEAIRFWGEEAASSTYFLPTVNWYDGKPVQQFYGEAMREISKQSVLGGILLSDAFCQRLSLLLKELVQESQGAMEERSGDQTDDDMAFGSHAGRVRDIADRHLGALIELARSDLGA